MPLVCIQKKVGENHLAALYKQCDFGSAKRLAQRLTG